MTFDSLDDELLETEAAELSAATVIQHVADEVLVKESGKLVFLIKLLDQLKVEGHRCLVFSQSRKILDIMQKVLTNKVRAKQLEKVFLRICGDDSSIGSMTFVMNFVFVWQQIH